MKKLIFFLVASLLWSLPVSPTRAETLAIFATDSHGVSIVELASVQLSQDNDVDLLERSRVTEILTEQKLTALGDQSDSLLLGRMLGVDLFAVWDQTEDTLQGRIAVFDGATGIRIEDRSIDAENHDLLVSSLASSIRKAIQKHQKITDSSLHLVSFAALRNINLPPAWHSFEDRVSAQLEQSLTQSPTIGLLEREQLRFVIKEEMLPIAQIQGRLLNSAELLTVQLSRIDRQTIKVELLLNRPGEQRPRQLAASIPFDASPAILRKSMDTMALSIARQADEARQGSSKAKRVGSEWQQLRSDAMRLLMRRQPFSAAIRFEAAYALGHDPEVLRTLMLAIRQCVLIKSNSRATTTRGRFLPGSSEITDEDWHNILNLGLYERELRRQHHQHEQQKLTWPFSDDSERLSSEFVFSHGLGSSVQAVDPNKSPAVLAALQAHYESDYDLVFTEFAEAARAKLTGSSRARFDEMLAPLELRWLTQDQDRHCLPNWDQRFVSALEQNLKYDGWMTRLNWLGQAIDDLSPAESKRLFQILSESDPQQNRHSHLGMRYLLLRHEKAAPGFQYSESFDSQIRRLISEVSAQIILADSTPETRQRGTQTVYAPGIGYEQNLTQRALGAVIDRSLWLIPDIMVRREIYVEAFMDLLEENVLQPQLLSRVLGPNYLYYVPEDRELLAQTIKIATESRFGLTASQHQSLMKSLTARSDRVSTPWSLKGSSRHISHLDLPWSDYQELTIFPDDKAQYSILAAEIVDGAMFVLARKSPRRSGYSKRQAASTVVQMYHVSRENGSAGRMLGELRISREQMDSENAEREVKQQIQRLLSSYFCKRHMPGTITADSAHVFCRTEAGGILVFPRNGTPPFKIDTTWGLPSNFIQQLTPIGNRLLAWVGEDGIEANFVTIDLTSREIRTLASCQRKEPKTPLDNLPRATCKLMMLSPEKNRAIMVIDDGFDPEVVGGYSQRNGVWQYDIATSKFSRFPTNGFQSRLFGRVGKSQVAIGRYDSNADKKLWRLYDLDGNQYDELGRIDLSWKYRPVCASQTEVWWHREGVVSIHRLDRKSGQIQEFGILPDVLPGRVALQFFADRNSAMICTDRKLWIAKLTTDEE